MHQEIQLALFSTQNRTDRVDDALMRKGHATDRQIDRHTGRADDVLMRRNEHADQQVDGTDWAADKQTHRQGCHEPDGVT
jgi:hypothetical protein